VRTSWVTPGCVACLIMIPVLLVACTLTDPQAGDGPAPQAVTPEGGGSWYQVYFTDPQAPGASEYEGGVDEALATAIDAAHASVDVAIYNLNLWSIRNALLDAHDRGVLVRVVAESDNLDSEEFQDLIEAQIAVLGDRREGSMHNKFVIIDQSEVWTGSMNFTLSGAYADNNNMIRVRSDEIAARYLAEFNEMFEQDLFGDDILPQASMSAIQIGETSVEVYFSPDDQVEARILEILEGARRSIQFLAFSFTSDPIGEALLSRAAARLDVTGVMDAEQAVSNVGTEYENFLQSGLDVRLDGNDGQMHDKVLIVDGEILITGSYNFSRNAEETNDENVLIIHDARLAATYLAEFQQIFAQAAPP